MSGYVSKNEYVSKQLIINKLHKLAIESIKNGRCEQTTAFQTAIVMIKMTKSANVQPIERSEDNE